MNIALLENQMARVFITIPVDQFDVYGGTKNGNFAVENTDVDNQVVVKIPAQGHKDCGVVRYEIFARNKTTNHEWLVLGGMVKTLDRESTLGDSSVTTPDYYMTVPISENGTVIHGTQIITGIKGERGYSAYEVACQQGFEGTEEEWFESIRQETATLAVEQVTPLMNRAEEAATNASNSETVAGDYAAGASRAEESAEEHAKDAAGSAAEAQAQAEAAIASAEVADEKARAAETAANEAFGYAAQAAAGAAGAQVDATKAANSASNAATSATSAESSKTAAAGSATAASTSATNAAKSASAAESAATQAAESAATVADAAMKSGNNTFAGINRFTGNAFFDGLLQGAPFWQVGGLFGNCLKGLELTEDELSAILPENLETWWDYPMPTGQRALENAARWVSVKNAIHIIDKALYGSGFYGVNKQLDNVVIYVAGDWYNSGGYASRAKNTLFISPLGKGTPYDTYGVGGVVDYHENIWVYIPKANGLSYNSYPHRAPKLQSYTVLGEHAFKKVKMDMPTPCQVLKTRAGFSSATSIIISGWQLNKESVMPILENLCVYDSATMTAVPTMTISMHTDLQADEEVQAALALASTAVEEGGKGWQVTTQWNGTATASTFALRPTPAPPVYVKREQSKDGWHVDAAGTRYSVDWGHMVTSPDGKDAEELGYTLFDSLEAALMEWGLTEIMEIPEEQ